MGKNQEQRGAGFDQWLLDSLVAIPKDGIPARARFRLLSAVRRFRLRFSDPLVQFHMCQMPLLLPLSHELPFYRRAYPRYSLNLGTVAAIVQHKYPNMTMVDVGANVGDSLAIVREQVNIPILCIEGEELFFRLLLKNTEHLEDVELEHSFLGAAGDWVRAVQQNHGTAKVESSSAPDGMGMRTLAETLARHPRFAASRFIKLDTEGFDCKIISGELAFLARNLPVLFFEYHLSLAAAAGHDPFSVFADLARIGYSAVVIYENVGPLLTSLDLRQTGELEQLHRYLSDSGGFCDVVAFSQGDLDIANAVRLSELSRDDAVHETGRK